ncbi:osmotically inducible lipoprotein OsmE [Microbacterium sp. SLBN-154]|uniref:hypothetical protein n=1 Tax=Microbacterium sp. SLBN-154 TaxID=2768458 RepID=UPI001150183E|nr:hypothetical protein [Microbacterium sp. SLBN-154]TQK20864.1 osmotically inducible lipoprotein OsmE [Microbacterium sp. SLBN-154]
MQTRRIVWIGSGIAAAVVVLIVIAVIAVTWLVRDPRQDLSLETFVPQEGVAGGPVEVAAFEGLRDETSHLCDGVQGCIEGYSAADATFYRFSSKLLASEFALTLDDAYQSDWILIDWSDSSLPEDERSLAEDVIDGTWTSE